MNIISSSFDIKYSVDRMIQLTRDFFILFSFDIPLVAFVIGSSFDPNWLMLLFFFPYIFIFVTSEKVNEYLKRKLLTNDKRAESYVPDPETLKMIRNDNYGLINSLNSLYVPTIDVDKIEP